LKGMCPPAQKASARSRRVIRKSLPASGELNRPVSNDSTI
jgi:hypothetical protein